MLSLFWFFITSFHFIEFYRKIILQSKFKKVYLITQHFLHWYDLWVFEYFPLGLKLILYWFCFILLSLFFPVHSQTICSTLSSKRICRFYSAESSWETIQCSSLLEQERPVHHIWLASFRIWEQHWRRRRLCFRTCERKTVQYLHSQGCERTCSTNMGYWKVLFHFFSLFIYMETYHILYMCRFFILITGKIPLLSRQWLKYLNDMTESA